MLQATNLSRRFGPAERSVRAVDGVDMRVAAGEFIAIAGRSGSGKSTLLSLLGTLDRPDGGRIEIDGVDVTALSEAELVAYRRDRIGFVFQSFNLVPNLTAIANVMLPMEFAGVPAAERRARAESLLERVELDTQTRSRKPPRMSGGEQQRVAIARALSNAPCLVLADEPTGNLDSETGALVIDLLKQITAEDGVSVVAVTHDREVAAAADRTLFLRDGRLVEPPTG